jgi:ribose 5-phosphate isomerase B
VRVAIGADHAGYRLKVHLVDTLKADGHEVLDLGTHSEEPADYPPICAAVAATVVDGEADRGIVLGGSGQGEQIAANKIPGARAALCNDLYTARLSREHNDANILSLGARIVAPELADAIAILWMDTPFAGGRHQRRLDQIAQLEKIDPVRSE